MVFHRSLSDSKSPQVSRILLSILANLNNTIVWMISRPLISKSSILFGDLLSVVITISTKVTFLFHRVFLFSSKVWVLISLLAFF